MDRDAVVFELGRLYDLTRHLRQECPWDRKQTQESIIAYTLEETYELVDAIRDRAARGDAAVCGELGDLLFQVYFLACVAEEQGLLRSWRRGVGDPRQAGPPAPPYLRRGHRRHAGRGAQDLGRHQAGGRGERGHFSRHPRSVSLYSLGSEAAAAGGRGGFRLGACPGGHGQGKGRDG